MQGGGSNHPLGIKVTQVAETIDMRSLEYAKTINLQPLMGKSNILQY